MPNPEIAPALVERMVKLVRELALPGGMMRTDKFGNLLYVHDEARAIVAELPDPLDADLLLAREVAASLYGSQVFTTTFVDGKADDSIAVSSALAAIRRVRAEQQPARATTWQEEH